MARKSIGRVINSTGRIEIKERDVSLTVVADPPTARLVEIALPEEVSVAGFEEARVFVEAAQAKTASFYRHDLGTVASVRGKKPVATWQLQQFADASDAEFVVKVVSPDGRILASADKVRPNERRSTDTESLLKVKSVKLEETPWKLHFADTGETLLLVNSRIPSAETWIEQDPIAASLVLPAALRVVLGRLVSDHGFRNGEWGEAWAEWAALRAPAPMPEPEDDEADDLDRDQWVDSVIDAFCKSHQTATMLVSAVAAPSEDQE